MVKLRQSRYRADPLKNKKMILQERDANIIYEIYKDQFLSTSQIQALFFNSPTTCKIRLRKLFNQGFLKRAFAPVSFGSSEAIYYPTQRGIELVSEFLSLNLPFKSATYRVRPEKQRHEIEVNQLKVSLIQSLKQRPEIELFFCLKGPETWDYVKDSRPNLKDNRELISIRPDRFIGLKINNSFQYFFLEVDRGTMKLKDFGRKLRGYRDYYFSGGFIKKYGKSDQNIKDFSFRVLTTAPTEERRNNLIEQALLEGSNMMMWFTTFKQAEQNFLGQIWIRGKEYKEILESLSKDEQKRTRTIHRKLERDRLIRERARFLGLV